MWLLKKKNISLLIVPFCRRLKYGYLLFTNKKRIYKFSNDYNGHKTNNYIKAKHTLFWYNASNYGLQYFIIYIHNLFLDQFISFDLIDNLMLLGNNTINCITIPNYGYNKCNAKRMCELAKETWLKGNIAFSFIQFSTLYDKVDANFRIKLIKVLQGLICLSVKEGGMAVVSNVTEHVKKFSQQKNEFSVLMTLWYALFNSSLYDDNCLADTLLEDLDFKLYLEPMIPCLGANFLKHNEVRCYQRLIETSLTHSLDNAAGILLRSLFNYYYKTGYFSGCSAVYECCILLEIKLTKDQIYKFSLLKKTGAQLKRKPHVIKHPKDLVYKF